jgi:hypothetical protein
MTIGLRAALLGLALILFVIAGIGEGDGDLLAWGLAALAAALLVGELGLGPRFKRR